MYLFVLNFIDSIIKDRSQNEKVLKYKNTTVMYWEQDRSLSGSEIQRSADVRHFITTTHKHIHHSADCDPQDSRSF